MGSWKIIAMLRPRSERMVGSLCCSKSSPLNRIRPDA